MKNSLVFDTSSAHRSSVSKLGSLTVCKSKKCLRTTKTFANKEVISLEK